jgi:hypothetical protein
MNGREQGGFVRRALLITIAIVAGAAQAHASAGVSCSIDDKSVVLEVGAAFGRSAGSGMINFGGNLKILMPEAPRDLRALKLERRKLSQIWVHYKDIKMQLYHERPQRGLTGSINLVLEARQDSENEDSYKGTYLLTIRYAEKKDDAEDKEIEAKGNVVCMTD